MLAYFTQRAGSQQDGLTYSKRTIKVGGYHPLTFKNFTTKIDVATSESRWHFFPSGPRWEEWCHVSVPGLPQPCPQHLSVFIRCYKNQPNATNEQPTSARYAVICFSSGHVSPLFCVISGFQSGVEINGYHWCSQRKQLHINGGGGWIFFKWYSGQPLVCWFP